MNKLIQVAADLIKWQKAEDAAKRKRSGRCLEAVRWAAQRNDLHLPMSLIDYPTKYAVDCGKALLGDPGKWGWQRVSSPLDQPCLCFFKKCGVLKSGAEAGHVAVYIPEKGLLVANNDYKWNQYWADRIILAVVPLS
jgi:hypothetical protein